MKDGIRNGYIVLGQAGIEKAFVKCGVQLNHKKGGRVMLANSMIKTDVKPFKKNHRSFKVTVVVDFNEHKMFMTEKATGQKLSINIPKAVTQIDTIGYHLDDATVTSFSNIKVRNSAAKANVAVTATP